MINAEKAVTTKVTIAINDQQKHINKTLEEILIRVKESCSRLVGTTPEKDLGKELIDVPLDNFESCMRQEQNRSIYLLTEIKKEVEKLETFV